MTESELPDHVARNRTYWDEVNAPRYVESGRRSWATNEITWGIFGVPEEQLHALPADVRGIGCRRARLRDGVRFRLARAPRGAGDRHRQLRGAAQNRAGAPGRARPAFPSHPRQCGDDRPARCELRPGREYGASIWADPYHWIPEAARILRPAGELVFLTNGLIWILTVPDLEAEGPAADRLLRPYFGMHRSRPARVGRVARPGRLDISRSGVSKIEARLRYADDKSIMFLAELLKAPVRELFPPRAAGKRLSDFMASRNTAVLTRK